MHYYQKIHMILLIYISHIALNEISCTIKRLHLRSPVTKSLAMVIMAAAMTVWAIFYQVNGKLAPSYYQRLSVVNASD
jgi:hypothetical protein